MICSNPGLLCIMGGASGPPLPDSSFDVGGGSAAQPHEEKNRPFGLLMLLRGHRASVVPAKNMFGLLRSIMLLKSTQIENHYDWNIFKSNMMLLGIREITNMFGKARGKMMEGSAQCFCVFYCEQKQLAVGQRSFSKSVASTTRVCACSSSF